jgi:alanine or glycine:cation symporter, AGCS family
MRMNRLARFLLLAFLSLAVYAQDEVVPQEPGPPVPAAEIADSATAVAPVAGSAEPEPDTVEAEPDAAKHEAEPAPSGATTAVNNFFGKIVGIVAPVLFFDVMPGEASLPFLLVLMFGGGIFFTFRFGFINLRLFKHGLLCVRGCYDNPDDRGEISHFQALTAALSATVGLGNIAGVAVAIGAGGPGVVFWMWIVAFFGMSMKYTSCTFAQLYRVVDEEGRVLGGPMVYLKEGFKERFPGMAGVGVALGALFAICTICGSIGGGNLFQANQTFELLSSQFTFAQNPWLVGVVMAALAGVVIIGGIRRIGEVTSKLVPAMCAFYCLTCMVIIFANFSQVPAMFASIFTEAFAPKTIAIGSFMGVLIQGIKRASFSNEAGLGSAAIAHSAAKTEEPVREGAVAMIGPFIDTHVVCTMTALTLLITGVYVDPEYASKGAEMTAAAFATLNPLMPKLLAIAACVFAFSTVISWSYYGEKATEYLMGRRAIAAYRVVYVLCIIVGPVLTLGNLIDFCDLMILSMGLPNIIGMIFLSGKVSELTKDYVGRLKSGEITRHK